MHQIFISYSSKHRELTRDLAAAIEAQYGEGSVWWDHALESRASYSDQIKAALEQARVVVVIWTAEAMISDYVYAEAVTAQAQGKLVNVRPADTSFRDIPEPFNIHDIDEAEDRQRILATIAKVMTGTPIPTRVPLHQIYYRQHGRRLIDPKQGKLARDPHEVSPSELLQAKFEVVGYADATGTAGDVLDWCTGPRRTGARLIHGPGGAGKTRLMIEVAARLRKRGWFAGFLDPPHEQVDATLKQRWQALEQLLANGEDEGLLIVLDYAEARQDEVRRIAEGLGGRPEEDTRAIRLVLLARSAGEWWSKLHDESPELQRLFRSRAATAEVISLPPIPAGDQRRALFEASLQAFGPWLASQGYGLPAGAPAPNRLRRIETEATRPLAIQMEALLWLASAAPEVGAIGVDVLLDRVLGLERRYWSKLLVEVDAERTRDLARALAQVTSVQGVPTSAAAERLLMADEFYKGQRTARVAVDPVLRNLSRAYGRPDGGIDPLQPDLIGEHHVASAGDIELITGCVRWIEEEPPQAQEKRRRDLLTVLQRATQPEHGAKATRQAATMLEHLVIVALRAFASAMVAVMIDTPGALAHCLDRRIDSLDDDDLAAVDDALPLQSLLLMDLSVRIAQRRADLARTQLDAVGLRDEEKTAQGRSHSAARLSTLGVRLLICVSKNE